MFNSNLMGIEIAGKFDNEAYDIARSVIIELETDLGLPIREVMDITAAGTGTFDTPINSRLPYRQLQGLARIGHLNEKNGIGAIDNLRGVWGEAIALDDFRSFPGVVVYEPVRQLAAVEQKIGETLIPGYQGNILKAFGNKTPDILSIQSQVNVPNGFFAPTLTNLVNPNDPSLIFDMPYPDKILVTAIEVTTATTRSQINSKSKNLAGFINPFLNSKDKVFVPILYMDKDVFNKLRRNNNVQEIVDRMRSVGGYIMLRSNLLENSSTLANNTAAIITSRVRSNQTSINIQNDKLPSNSFVLNPAIISQEFLQPYKSTPSKTEPLPIASKLNTQKDLSNEPDYHLVVDKIIGNASKFTALGLDVRNKRDLNVAIAIIGKVGGWDTKNTLKQSSQYQDLFPEKKAAWLEGVINQANELLPPKEESNKQSQITKPQRER
jgi:hypothetical protein